MATLNKKIRIIPSKDGGTNSLKDEIQNIDNLNSLEDNMQKHIKTLDESKLAIEQTQKKLKETEDTLKVENQKLVMELDNINFSIQNSNNILNIIKTRKEKYKKEIDELNSVIAKSKIFEKHLLGKNLELENKIKELEDVIKLHKFNELQLNKEPEIKSPNPNQKRNIKIISESNSITISSGENLIELKPLNNNNKNNNNNLRTHKHLNSSLNKELIEEEKQKSSSQRSSSSYDSSICISKDNIYLNFSNSINEKDKLLFYKSTKTNKFIRINLYDNNNDNIIYYIADINKKDILNNNNHFIYIGEIKKIHVGAIDHNIGSISNKSSYHDYDIGIKTNVSRNYIKIDVIDMKPIDIAYNKIVNNNNININNTYSIK